MGRKGLCSLLLAGGAAAACWQLSGLGPDLLPIRSCDAQVSVQTCPKTNVDESPAEQRPRLPPPKYGKHITVLSIDGGGIRGLIPLQALKTLEKNLKDIDNDDNARIADYFDVMAGTSTGGLIAAMLAVPDDRIKIKEGMVPRPKYTPQAIQQFYWDNGPKIFHVAERGSEGFKEKFLQWYDFVRQVYWGPRYDNKELRKAIDTVLNGPEEGQAQGNEWQRRSLTLGDTVTRVLLVAYDVQDRRVQNLTSSILKNENTTDSTLAKCSCGSPTPVPVTIPLLDACLGTTAAPVYFRAHDFKHGERKYNLIDGGVARNNPTLQAIRSMFLEVESRCKCGKARNPDFHKDPDKPDKLFDMEKFLVLSIGTGSSTKAYEAKECAQWGFVQWLKYGNRKPLLDIFTSTSASLIDIDTGFLFRLCNSQHNYLRIAPKPVEDEDVTEKNAGNNAAEQNVDNNAAENKKPDMALDAATEDNMRLLIEFGEKLLNDPVKRIVNESRKWIPTAVDPDRTNKVALREFAEWLCAERNLRIAEQQKEGNAGTSSANSSPSN